MLSRCIVSALILLVLLAAMISPVAAVGESEPAAPAKHPIPDVLLLIWVTDQMDRVSFTYQEVVNRDTAEAHLGSLLRETGWTANNINIEDVKMADGSATTTVEFSTLGTVNLSSGAFPLEPIVKAFKDERYLEVEFIISMPFEFKGLQQFENKHVKISLNRGTNAYGYSVFIKDPNFKTLDLPLLQTEAAATSKSADGKPSKLLVFALIVTLGFFAAMLVYFLTKRAGGSDSIS